MIKLSNVSISKLYYKIKKKCRETKNDLEHLEGLAALTIIDDNKIENYQQLKDMFELFKKNKFYNFIKKDLEQVESKINEANKLGVKPEIYEENWYDGTKIDDKSILQTDSRTKGNVLLMSSPLHLPDRKQRIINIYSIHEIKSLLRTLQSDLRNEFRFVSGCYSQENVEKLIYLIKFYEHQVERQAKEIKETYPDLLPTNIFAFNSIDKQDIVESQIKEIAEYLVDSENSLIWGNLNDKEKIRLLKVINSPHDFARRNFINAISNYTTLTELEQGIVKTKTLDRFIVR